VEESGGIEEERLTVLGIETGVGVGTRAGIGTEVGTEREIGTGERTGTGTQGGGGMDRGNGTSVGTGATTGAGVRTRSTATGTSISRTSMRGGTEAEERRRREMGTSRGAQDVEQTQGGGGGVGTGVGTEVGTTVQDTSTGGRVGNSTSVTDEQIERAWEPVLQRLLVPRRMLVTNAQAGDLKVSARIPRLGRLLTAQLIDPKVKGMSGTDLDHSMELPPGRMHTVGFGLERFSRS
jgi:hypothetical protein